MAHLYQFLLFAHILSACVWLGGGFFLQALYLRLGSNPTKSNLLEFFSLSHWVSPRIFMPAAILTLGTGLLLVFLGGASWSDAWIIIALVGVAITIGIGATQIGPTVRKLRAALERGETEEKLAAFSLRLNIVTRLDLTILIAVLLDMVFKP